MNSRLTSIIRKEFIQIFREPHLDGFHAQASQYRTMFFKISL